MSDPANIPPSGGPPINIPATGGTQPPTNPKKQTVRISLPPKRPTPPTEEEEEEERRFTLKPQKRTLIDRWRDLTPATKKKIKILILCAIGIIGIALLFNPAKVRYEEWAEKRKIEASYKQLLRGKEEELEKVKAIVEKLQHSAEIEKEEKEKFLKILTDPSNTAFSKKTNVVYNVVTKYITNEVAVMATNAIQPSATHSQVVTNIIQHSTTSFVQTYNAKNITVNNYNGDGGGKDSKEKKPELPPGMPASPDREEDLIPGKGKVQKDGSEIITVWVPPGGNGVRYHTPDGWKSRLFTTTRGEHNYDVWVNIGARDKPIWTISEFKEGTIDPHHESYWIRNRKDVPIKAEFVISP